MAEFLSGAESIRARIDRADHLLGELNHLDAKIVTRLQAQIQRSREDSGFVWRFDGPTIEIPPEYCFRVGEIVHNLRSSLDHAVWQLVIASGDEPGRNSAYPITADEEKWDSAASRCLEGIDQRARAVIRLNQPWHAARNGYTLYSLHCLSNIDKHRHPNVSVAVSTGIINHTIPHGASTGNARGEMVVGALYCGKELLRLTGISGKYDPGIRLSIVFAGGGEPPPELTLWWYEHKSVVEFLRKCSEDVRGVLRELHLVEMQLPPVQA